MAVYSLRCLQTRKKKNNQAARAHRYKGSKTDTLYQYYIIYNLTHKHAYLKKTLTTDKVYKILELEGRIQALARQLFDTEGDCGLWASDGFLKVTEPAGCATTGTPKEIT